jgi:hypothetical protein
MPGIPREMI